MSIIVINNYFKPKYRCRACQIVATFEDLDRECELFYYTEINEVTTRVKKGKAEAVVLSGSSAHVEKATNLSKYKLEIDFIKWMKSKTNVPLLGICFGHQLIGKAFGSKIGELTKPRKGFKAVRILEPNDLFSSWRRGEKILLCKSHSDFVENLPVEFTLLARSEDFKIEAMKHNYRPIYGVQAHIERNSEECKDGLIILKNFVKNVVDAFT